MRRPQLCTSTITILAALSPLSNAQWSDDSTMHQIVADGPGEQVQPKIVATTDGGCYISWFSSDSGYDVRIQRLDSQGNPLWASSGVLVADRNFSSTQEYGLAIDTSDHAVLVFRDDRFGGTRITAQRIAPDGSTPWGPDGFQFGNGTDFVASPDIASTDDGSSVIGWINESETRLAKISDAGMTMWTTTIADPGGESINLASMHRSDENTIIMSWVQFGTFFGPKNLYAQKISSDGTEAWPSRVAVFDGGSLQFGNFPEFTPDTSGGAVFSWYDTAGPLNVFAQRLASDGSEMFPHNGVVVSTAPRDRVAPEAAYDPATDSALIGWVELANNQGSSGIYAQRLDSTGARQWTDSGVELSPINSNSSGTVNVQMLEGNLVTMWIQNNGSLTSDQIQASALDPAGLPVWSAGTVNIASNFAQRSRLRSAVSTEGFIIAGWQIGDFGVADIETHNLNADGSLGTSSCAADLTGEGDLNFLDVSAFLAAFGSMDPVADFTADSDFNFLDVSAFLAAFAAGCP
ncbi:MAG: GC-type dockerin domain-anchored protein [Phycisphaerales bacterium]